LPRFLLLVFIICSIKLISWDSVHKFLFFVSILNKHRCKLWSSKGFINYNRLLPVFISDIRIWVVEGVWMHIQMCRLQEFIHIINWFWLFIPNERWPSTKQIVIFNSIIIFSPTVKECYDISSLFLLKNNIESKCFNCTSWKPV
jgi:hypothetical protein